jgi:hypothetical protein
MQTHVGLLVHACLHEPSLDGLQVHTLYRRTGNDSETVNFQIPLFQWGFYIPGILCHILGLGCPPKCHTVCGRGSSVSLHHAFLATLRINLYISVYLGFWCRFLTISWKLRWGASKLHFFCLEPGQALIDWKSPSKDALKKHL